MAPAAVAPISLLAASAAPASLRAEAAELDPDSVEVLLHSPVIPAAPVVPAAPEAPVAAAAAAVGAMIVALVSVGCAAAAETTAGSLLVPLELVAPSPEERPRPQTQKRSWMQSTTMYPGAGAGAGPAEGASRSRWRRRLSFLLGRNLLNSKVERLRLWLRLRPLWTLSQNELRHLNPLGPLTFGGNFKNVELNRLSRPCCSSRQHHPSTMETVRAALVAPRRGLEAVEKLVSTLDTLIYDLRMGDSYALRPIPPFNSLASFSPSSLMYDLLVFW